MPQRLFASEVVCVLARPGMETAPLHPDEAACLGQVAPKRLREFAAGRAAAREALARLGIRSFPLRIGSDRAPLWPPDVVGSISHCEGSCAVAIARRGEIVGLGIDVERTGRVTAEIAQRILGPDERRALARLPVEALPAGVDWETLVFSAKESIYKCYFPLTRTALGFRDLEVELLPGRSRFHGRLVNPDRPGAAGQRGFEGSWLTEPQRVFTGVTLRAPRPEPCA